jgi:2-oxoacid:acceptor oxidoreductase gamma subunit (pyruvate/2-ketoisovalerate family)
VVFPAISLIELRFHGRGGQGAVVAAELLAQAAFLEGKHPQSFPFFGVERRGAPVTAFTRIDDEPIGVRTSVTSPDIVVVLDPSLIKSINVTAGLKPDGLLLVNSPKDPSEFEKVFPGRVATVDATGIALANGLGTRATPIVNTCLLGALARAAGIVRLESVLKAIERHVPAKREENRNAAKAAADGVRMLQAVVA